MNNKLDVLVLFSLFMAAIGAGFLFGSSVQKKWDVEYCKLSGWEFIEEKIFPRSMVRDTFYSTKEQQLQGLMDLQANIATKCIVNIK